MTILKANSCSIGQKSGEIWTGQTLLQPISFKSDRLLDRELLAYLFRFSGLSARKIRTESLNYKETETGANAG
ncbi:MAG: hypothetical protein L0H15_05150 [Nitrosospira sp.]|nr:hypothetical protein [Nitrosospira sp.]